MGTVDYTPRTWTYNLSVNQTILNTEVRDPFTSLQGAWTTWNPAQPIVSIGGTNPTMGNSTIAGATHQIGKTWFWRLRIMIGSTFAAGSGTYSVLLPTSVGGILATEEPVGYGQVYTTVRRGITAYVYSATTALLVRQSNETEVTASGVGVAWAAGQMINLTGMFQAA